MDRLVSVPKGSVEETAGVTDRTNAVERCYREQADRLWHALVLFCGDQEVANDAVSEAFAQAIGRGPGIDDVDRWVWRSAFNIARGDLKRRGRQTSKVPDLPAEVPTETVDPRTSARNAHPEAARIHRAPPLRGLLHQRNRPDHRVDGGSGGDAPRPRAHAPQEPPWR
jgi:DNA-directed RNA polymerase specialized sigma24 family protein